MVRLKGERVAGIPADLLEFTFHYGKIKSSCSCSEPNNSIRFTFHYGKIKSDEECDWIESDGVVYIPLW